APARSLSRHPLFQVGLTLQNNARASLDLAGARASARPPASPGGSAAKFDLEFFFGEKADESGRPAGLGGELIGAADLFDRVTVEGVARRLERVLGAVVADPGLTLSAVPVLDEAERRRVLYEWNDTAADVVSSTLPGLFVEQVARTPDAVAVVFEGVELSYAELDARANHLAFKLAAVGVGPESVVGVVLDRSVEMLVALLGVLKAGAAYLPVDPGLPAERVGFMFAASGARHAVTSQEHGSVVPDSVEVIAVDG